MSADLPVEVPLMGARVWVATEKRPYRVRARNERFAVCTKPFNPRRTVLYCILDARNRLRGPENLIFGMGAETDGQCDEMLQRLSNGQSEVSHRRCVEWDIIRVDP